MMDLTKRGHVAVLTMTHGKANAMDLEFCAPDVGALVITGQGKIFSAGVDLLRIVEGGAEYVRRFLPALSALLEAAFAFEKPIVAAVNGHAIAGGCILACAADRKIIGHTATIGVPELLVGVPFPVAPLEILRFAVSPQHLQALIHAGAVLPAESAVAHGLADVMVEPVAVMRRATMLAESMIAIAPGAFAMTKRQLREPTLQRIRDASPRHDPAIVDAWADPMTLRAIRDYVERTFKKA
jgi:enoyl-CoA hydratase